MSNERSNETDFNATIKCLLALRSVYDQAVDAELDLLTDELKHKLISLENGLIDHLARQREQQDGLGLLTVSVVGDFNSGKSTFINALLGMDICPVGDEPTTASVTYFIHGAQERIEQEKEGKRIPLRKSKYHALACHKKEGDNKPHTFHISINSPILGHIRLVDTPGFNAPPPNTNDTRVTQSAVVESDVLFVLRDIHKGNPSDTLLDQLDQLSQNTTNGSHQLVFLLLNKAEKLSPPQRTEVRRVCIDQHGDRFRKVVLVSALQLNESEDEEPLDALDSAMQRIRSAYKTRDSFKENISAKLTPQSYRLDISGNVYDVPTSSDFELASRGQLVDMVKSVLAERHALLERQFQRNTLQLRENWQTTLSLLDQKLKQALSESSGHDENKRRETALKAIEKAKNETLNLVGAIFEEISDKIVFKDQRFEEGFWSDRVYYQVRIYLDRAHLENVMNFHDNWCRIDDVYKGLLSFLKRSLDMDFSPTPQQFVEELVKELKKYSLDQIPSIPEKQKLHLQDETEAWEYIERGKFWKYDYEDDEYSRDKLFDLIKSDLRSQEKKCILNFTQKFQVVIDYLNEEVISTTERNQSQVEERTEELRKLQERINKMKEHTP